MNTVYAGQDQPSSPPPMKQGASAIIKDVAQFTLINAGISAGAVYVAAVIPIVVFGLGPSSASSAEEGAVAIIPAALVYVFGLVAYLKTSGKSGTKLVAIVLLCSLSFFGCLIASSSNLGLIVGAATIASSLVYTLLNSSYTSSLGNVFATAIALAIVGGNIALAGIYSHQVTSQAATDSEKSIAEGAQLKAESIASQNRAELDKQKAVETLVINGSTFYTLNQNINDISQVRAQSIVYKDSAGNTSKPYSEFNISYKSANEGLAEYSNINGVSEFANNCDPLLQESQPCLQTGLVFMAHPVYKNEYLDYYQKLVDSDYYASDGTTRIVFAAQDDAAAQNVIAQLQKITPAHAKQLLSLPNPSN